MAEQLLAVNGSHIFATATGPAGAPWVVFLNSLAADTEMWSAQAETLSASHRVLRLDWRGHGRSQAEPGPYTMDLLAGDVLGCLATLGIRRAHFVGSSMGGMLTLWLAVRQAPEVASASICSAGARMSAEASAAWSEVVRQVRSLGVRAVVDNTLARWFTPAYARQHPHLMDRVRQMIVRTSVEGYTGCVAAIQDFDVLGSLPEIRIPLQFIVGQEDPAATPETMRIMHAQVPNSGFHVIPRAAHLPSIEQPQALSRLLLEFLPAGS